MSTLMFPWCKRTLLALLLVGLAGGRARADKVVWRLATSAPDSTAWSRELRAFARDVENVTDGQLAIKWYFGGIAGDEAEAMARVGKAQLDGFAAGTWCSRVVPSMKVFAIPGVVQDRDEAVYIAQRMMPVYVAEAQRSGFMLLSMSGLGPEVVFSRAPVTTMEELRKTRLFVWDLDLVNAAAMRALGLAVETLPLDQATRAYDQHQVDGFAVVPQGALAFQWSTQARYMTDLRLGYLEGCLLVANRAWDRLAHAQRQGVLAAAAKGGMRLEDIGRATDNQLMNGLFARQGMKVSAPSQALRLQYFEAGAGGA
jgi:TRAP-type C4-dicarboxylate transport system substrate-binding protein